MGIIFFKFGFSIAVRSRANTCRNPEFRIRKKRFFVIPARQFPQKKHIKRTKKMSTRFIQNMKSIGACGSVFFGCAGAVLGCVEGFDAGITNLRTGQGFICGFALAIGVYTGTGWLVGAFTWPVTVPYGAYYLYDNYRASKNRRPNDWLG